MQSVCLTSSSDPSPESKEPYLSVVATARNDNHGGNLLGRMQVFVDAWINQCKKHNLASELILVEWNPPPDKPKLVEALRWPSDMGPCQVRIIEVPPELHRRYRHAATLPLYQMIAKNVGIRRARGKFIVATNIDVVFSDELVEFLAQRKLQTGRLYRIDRTDVGPDVPVDGTLEDQLAYCSKNIIRLCARDGIFALTPEGMRSLEANDIIQPNSGIWYGDGWFEVELYTVEHFRWIRDEADLFLRVPDDGAVLQLELEPGPGVAGTAASLLTMDGEGNNIGEFAITGRTTLKFHVPPAPRNGLQRLRLKVSGGGKPVPHDPRIMNFRFFRIDWVPAGATEIRSFQETIKTSRLTLARFGMSRIRAGFSSILQLPWTLWRTIRLLRMRGVDIFDGSAEFRTGQGWHDMGHHPDQERYRTAESTSELSFRFSEGTTRLALVLEPGPANGYLPFDLTVQTADDRVVHRARIQGLTYLEFAVPVEPRGMTTVFLKPEDGGPCVDYRVYACGRGEGSSPQDRPDAQTTGAGSWFGYIAGARPAGIDWRHELRDYQKEIAEMGLPQFLHLYACGDFQLMSRENWDDVRGYAELDQFSMHLDSLLSYTANHMGVQEQCLPAPMRVYHVEHDVGTGWTPEGYKELSARIAKKGIQMINFQDLAGMVAQMRRLRAPFVFNLDTWGMADCNLTETSPAPVADPTAA